ncbi:MAG: phosphopantetheine-binding protein [Oscillospiraceae bacterium]|nr:phosphopantetheine-binding protein [Oscillospiraceae bacterium]
MLEKLIAILEEYVDLKDMKITEDTDLKNELDINSIELAEIICAVEDEFDIEIPNKDVYDMNTLGDVIRFLESHQ